MGSSYILDINLLSDMWFANNFPHSVGFLFILFIIPFAMQKLFSLMQSYLLIFNFVACGLGVISKNSLPRPMSESFFHLFSWKSCIVSGLAFVFNPF